MLKVWVDKSECVEKVTEALKLEPEFILDEYRDIGEYDELPINLHYVKIGDYYLFDNEYIDVFVEEIDADNPDAHGYKTVLTDIFITTDESNAMHIENWEIEHLKQALKGEIEIITIEEKENN